MVPDFSPLFYLVFIAIGAVIGVIIGTVLWGLAFIWPALAGWSVAPPIIGALCGLIFAWRADD